MTSLDSQFAAALGSRYRLERELGAGGMATVHLATDLKHQRRVAVKVLRPELAAALGHERFLREITTTANLRHPNILPLFDSGEAAGMVFYVMPFIEGESLRDRIARDGALPLEEAVRIADEVADALHYAHSRGVIHRDIKPENILLESEHAIVADFGIAHAVSAAGDEKLTMIGLALGTPQYMSPEQGSGDTVDARSDLYALGCVLFEMLAGAPPFTAPTAMAVMVKHAIDPVPSLTTARPEVTAEIVAAVERTLAKTPAERFASLGELRAVLKRARSAGASGSVDARVPGIHKPPPSFSTPLLGRAESLAAATAKLREGVRVLSITGYGGTGKTRFGSELLKRLEGDYAGGGAFISLASVTDPAEVLPTIGMTLDIAEARGRSALDAVVTVIGDRRVLLLLDNLEQVVESAEEIAALVSRCPHLQVVATSRRPLRISAEVELALPPLDVPAASAQGVEALLACPSVALFVQRAEKVKPDFMLTDANAAAIAAICRSLDGLPLALELAAARVRILEPAALLQRLDHALDLLTSGDRDLPLRQRTLRATISWSYSLLTAGEQALLRRLSTFHEGWTLEALERVCYADADRWSALDELSSLVEKGLVRVVSDGARYSLLETVRAFAAEQLHAGGEVDRMRDAHAAFYLEFARAVDRGIQGGAQLDAMARARTENANLFAALQWLLVRARLGQADAIEQGLRMTGWLGWYWHIVGLHLVAHETVHALLAMVEGGPPSLGRAVASFTSGMVAANTGAMQDAIRDWTRMTEDGAALGEQAIHAFGRGGIGYALLGMGQLAEARAPLDEAVALAEQARDEFLVALMRTIRGMQRFVTGDLEGGIAEIEAAHRVQVRLGDCEGGGMALSFLAQMFFAKGETSRATELYRDSAESFTRVGDKPELARVQGELGYVALAGGESDAARRWFQAALRTNDEIGSPRGTGQALFGLAATEAAAGNTERAVAIAAAAQVMSERAGVVVEHPMAPGLAERIEAIKASVPRGALDDLVAQGRSLTPAAVLAMAGA